LPVWGFLMRGIGALVLAICAACLFAQPAFAEKRVALVIGNSAYQNVNRLTNPANDSDAISATFRGAGFDVVELRHDLKVNEMRRALRDFSDSVLNADVAIIYFAGHGIEIDGTNYVIPVDAVLERDIDAFDEAIPLDRLLAVIESAKQLRLVILDACRDNPFSKTMKRTNGSRAVSRGLARVEPATVNTLVAFAAKAGSIASDGDGKNSPFTAALVKYLPRPGLDLRKALGFARDEVLKATNNRQEPFIYGSLGGNDLALVPAAAPPPAATTPADPRRDYELAERMGTKPVWDSFISTYPSGFYTELAKAQRDKLAAEAASVAATEKARAAQEEQKRLAIEGAKATEQAKAAAQALAAEEMRIAAEKKKAIEEAKVAEAERAKAAAQARETEVARIAAENANAAKEAKAAQERITAEKKKVQEEAKAAEAQRAQAAAQAKAEEEARLATAKAKAADERKKAIEDAKVAEAERAKAAAQAREMEVARIAAEKANAVKEAKAAQERIAAERKKAQEEAKAAEAQRAQAAAAAKAEEVRLATEKAKAAGEKKRQDNEPVGQLAALAPPEQASEALAKPDKAAAEDVPRLLQTELRRVGCNIGATDGNWNAAAQRSLELFNKNARTKFDVKVASLDALDAVRSKAARVCPLICDHGYKADGDSCTKITCRTGYEMGDDNTCKHIEVKKREKPVASVNPSAPPDATGSRNVPSNSATPRSPKEYEPMGSGKVSNGHCTCKANCNKFASAGQLSGSRLGQCKSDCEQKYAGCNKGALR
jgi:Caspase domain